MTRQNENGGNNGKERKKLQAAAAAAACVLAGTLAIGGTFAYLTDRESAVNTFTVGKVQIDLKEPDYPGNDSTQVKNLLPNQEILKNPIVVNTGVNDAIVFATVEVPVKQMILAAADGTRGEDSPTELFWFKDAGAPAGTFDHSFHVGESDGWIRLVGQETKGKTDGSTTTYVFAYKNKLAAGQETASLFDKIQLKNVVEGEIPVGEAQNIKVKSYAIQASEILQGNVDLTDTLDITSLESIYKIYIKQSGTEAEKDAGTSNQLDLSGNERV